MTINEILNIGLDVLKNTVSNGGSSVSFGDNVKASAIAIAIEQVIGVKPDILTDNTSGSTIYTLYFADTTKAANALVATIDQWRGKLASGDNSSVRYNFAGALVPAIIRSFFLPVALVSVGIGSIGYYIGKAN